ncbi:hypothetical protein HYU09_03240 [Candidatus Woesearchaeota archaeon]|nr:hypothetical protein [Candidatus Woesearchaeota archaeon]
MDRKAASITEFVGWAAGILVVIVIIALIFAPSQLFAKVREQALNFGFGFLPEQKKPEFQGQVQIPQEVQDYSDKMLSQIGQQSQKKNCIVDLGEIPDSNKFSIAIYNDKVQIEAKNIETNDKAALTPALKTSSVQGLKPCEVSGSAAVNLHGCFVWGQEKYCKDMSRTSGTIVLEKGKYSRYALRDEKGICVIRIYDDGFTDFGQCNPPRYDGRDGIDKDCIKSLEAKLC